MVKILDRIFRRSTRPVSREQLLLDEFSRQLDKVETQVPMMGGYQRIDPYVREYQHGSIRHALIIYHAESKAWFDNDHSDSVLTNAERYEMVHSGDTVFDLGCNSGFLTTWFAKRVGPAGKVLAFDPFPWNTMATLYSGRLNGCENIECHTVGIAAKHGSVTIPFSDSKIYANSHVSETNCFDAELVPLDAFASRRPDYIKVDIEGAERELLAGARQILSQNPKPVWLFELHHEFIRAAGSDPDAICRELIDQGYVCRVGDPVRGERVGHATVTPSGCAIYATRPNAS